MTGGTGAIGEAVCRGLAERGCDEVLVGGQQRRDWLRDGSSSTRVEDCATALLDDTL